MYNGNTTANFVRFDITDAGGQSNLFNPPSPVQISGFTDPNSDPVFFQLEDDGWCGTCNDGLNLYTVNVDWNDPANATLNGPTLIGLTAFDTNLCSTNSFNCIPQQGSNTVLDPVSQVLMNNPTYRSWNGNESIVATFSVDIDGNDLAGIRWFELRKSGATWSVFQEGTFAPSDGLHRWMGSISMNQNGEIGLIYNVSGINLFPSIRYTGRVPTDQNGVMSYAEQILIAGSSSNLSNRYGDYNGLVVDPDGDADFWGTAMYTDSGNDARTRIGEFNIPDVDGIYVDNTNSNSGDGSINNPYNTFLSGLDNSCPDCTIFIHRGVYDESFPVVIEGIQLLIKSYEGNVILR